jgi:hypothetical protein
MLAGLDDFAEDSRVGFANDSLAPTQGVGGDERMGQGLCVIGHRPIHLTGVTFGIRCRGAPSWPLS